MADAARGIHLHRRHRHAAHLRPGRAGTSRRGRAARNGSRPRRPRPSALGARYSATAVGAGRPDAQQPQSGQPMDDARLPAAAAALRLHAFRRRRRRTAVRRAARFRRRKGLRGTNDVRYLGGVQRTVHRFSEPPLGRTHVRTDDLRRGRRRIRLRRHAKPLSHRPAIPLGQRFPRRPRRGADRRRADGAHRQDGPLRPRTALRNRRIRRPDGTSAGPPRRTLGRLRLRGPPSTTRAVNSPSSAP